MDCFKLLFGILIKIVRSDFQRIVILFWFFLLVTTSKFAAIMGEKLRYIFPKYDVIPFSISYVKLQGINDRHLSKIIIIIIIIISNIVFKLRGP